MIVRMKVLFVIILFWFLSTAHIGLSAIINVSSLAYEDVVAALGIASAGDTVVLPAGTATWTSSVSWNAPANVTLMGAGSLSTQGGGDATVIVDGYNSSVPLFTITANATGTLRIAGLTVRGDATYSPLKQNGMVGISGGTVRIDHVHLDVTQGTIKPLWLAVYGVLDHSIIDAVGNSAIYFGNGAGASRQGNEAWAAPTGFGTANFFFMEDNLWRATVDFPIRIGDCFTASRVVWRFNTIQGGSGLEVHATGHAGDDRGARAVEAYGNSFTVLPDQANPPYDMANPGSGTWLIWGNVSDLNNLKNGLVFNVTRKNADTYVQTPPPNGWGYAGTAFNGTGSAWDGNTDESTGYPCLDQPGRGQGDLLIGSFPSKVNSTTGTIAWPNQALEPIYIWNNFVVPNPAYGGSSIYNDNTGGRVVANRDYYPQASGVQTSPTSPFNGTVGTGWGTLANRPTTCTTGVGYWATDQGSWNTSASNPYGVQQNGASGVLYQCTATNTWTLYYTPYTYPHPLQVGGDGPDSPHDLHVVQ